MFSPFFISFNFFYEPFPFLLSLPGPFCTETYPHFIFFFTLCKLWGWVQQPGKKIMDEEKKEVTSNKQSSPATNRLFFGKDVFKENVMWWRTRTRGTTRNLSLTTTPTEKEARLWCSTHMTAVQMEWMGDPSKHLNLYWQNNIILIQGWNRNLFSSR